MARRAADDELFTVAPEEFTAARKRIELELRQAGDPEGAARVKALRKPPLTVWAANQLARRKPEEVAELLAISDQLRRAQAQALAGRESDFLELGRRQRSEVGRLVGLAGTLAREAGHATGPAFARRLGATLQAAATGDADALRAGRLLTELTPASTFGEAGAKVAAAVPVRKERGRERESDRERERERERERQRERERGRKIAKLKKVARVARAEADKRRRAAERAEELAVAAESAVRDAEKS